MAHLLITRRNWSTVLVETSHSACIAFGCRHGDCFVDRWDNRGEVMGVGNGVGKQADFEVLWVILDKNRCPSPSAINGFATYYANRKGDADASGVCMRLDDAADKLDFAHFLRVIGDGTPRG